MDRRLGAAGQEMRGEGMTQGMRGGVGAQALEAAEIAHGALGHRRVQTLAADADEEGGVGGGVGVQAKPGGEGFANGGQDGDEALLRALAQDTQGAGLGLGSVAHRETQGFRNAQPTAIEKREKSGVAGLDHRGVRDDADVLGDGAGLFGRQSARRGRLLRGWRSLRPHWRRRGGGRGSGRSCARRRGCGRGWH